MCGPSAQQTASQDELAQLQAQSLKEAQTTYGEDQAILGQLTPIYSTIAAKGPNQEGFSPEELEALNAQAVEGTAKNYQNASKAINEQIAAEGGGTNPLPSGAQIELKQQVANAAASEESKEETGIKAADYNQGFSEFQDATRGLLSIGTQLSPTTYTGAATGAGNAAADEANKIAAQQNSWLAPVLGAVGSIGGGFAGDFSFGGH